MRARRAGSKQVWQLNSKAVGGCGCALEQRADGRRAAGSPRCHPHRRGGAGRLQGAAGCRNLQVKPRLCQLCAVSFGLHCGRLDCCVAVPPGSQGGLDAVDPSNAQGFIPNAAASAASTPTRQLALGQEMTARSARHTGSGAQQQRRVHAQGCVWRGGILA